MLRKLRTAANLLATPRRSQEGRRDSPHAHASFERHLPPRLQPTGVTSSASRVTKQVARDWGRVCRLFEAFSAVSIWADPERDVRDDPAPVNSNPIS
jgi:hypothetical protein